MGKKTPFKTSARGSLPSSNELLWFRDRMLSPAWLRTECQERWGEQPPQPPQDTACKGRGAGEGAGSRTRSPGSRLCSQRQSATEAPRSTKLLTSSLPTVSTTPRNKFHSDLEPRPGVSKHNHCSPTKPVSSFKAHVVATAEAAGKS